MSENTVRSLKDESRAASPQKILVPIDTLPGCGTALEHATGLAAALGAELVLLGIAPVAHAAPLLADFDGKVVAALSIEQRLLDRLAQERLDQAVGALPPSVRSRTVLTWGSPGPAISDAARKEGADVILVPMRRGGELARMFRDHVDRHVLHHSPVPVLVVPVGLRSRVRPLSLKRWSKAGSAASGEANEIAFGHSREEGYAHVLKALSSHHVPSWVTRSRARVLGIASPPR